MNHEKSTESTLDAAEEKFFTTPLIIIFITVFIDLIGFGMVIPILPYYANNPPFNATPQRDRVSGRELFVDAVLFFPGAWPPVG